mgnify:CR=1 FL=1
MVLRYTVVDPTKNITLLVTTPVPRSLQPQTAFHSCEGSYRVETLDVTQGKLTMGLRTPITVQDPRYPAMMLLKIA